MDWQTLTKPRGRKILVLMSVVLLVMTGVGLSQADRTSSEKKEQEVGVIDPSIIDEMRNNLPGRLSALPPVPLSRDDSKRAEKVRLGMKLFMDPAISGDGKTSCAYCHDPEKAFADRRSHALRNHGGPGRHTPTLLNVVYDEVFGWGGETLSLKNQVANHLVSSYGNDADPIEVVRSISNRVELRDEFHKIFRDGHTLESITEVLTVYVETLTTPKSRFDNYMRGDTDALTQEEKRGLILFVGKASCTQCHKGANFTDSKFYNLGVDTDEEDAEDPGRFKITRLDEDWHSFKTPGLRNVDLTGPYMHDGSLGTLEDVVEFYDYGGGCGVQGTSLKLKQLNLSDREKTDLVAFLKSLTGEMPE